MISIHKYIFDILDSNMYLLIENNKAIIIDPHYSIEANKLLENSSIEEIDIILTHEHFDHVSGIMHYAKFARDIYANRKCAEILNNPRNRINSRFAAFFVSASKEKRYKVREACKTQILSDVTCVFEEEYQFDWNNHSIWIKSTPGHTPGSVCIIIDNTMMFSGDSLIPDHEVITGFPEGSQEHYDNITQPFLQALDKNLLVYPGHGEEKKLGDML